MRYLHERLYRGIKIARVNFFKFSITTLRNIATVSPCLDCIFSNFHSTSMCFELWQTNSKNGRKEIVSFSFSLEPHFYSLALDFQNTPPDSLNSLGT